MPLTASRFRHDEVLDACLDGWPRSASITRALLTLWPPPGKEKHSSDVIANFFQTLMHQLAIETDRFD